jgi:hypothetical protein
MRKYLDFFAFILLFFLSMSCLQASGIRISGKITEENGASIPFSNIYLEGTSIGTTSNIDGNYSLDLEPGNYKLVFRFIGFKQRTENVLVSNSAIVLNVILVPESYQLKEVNIKANAEDPAYAIIRKAQKKRKDYLKEVEEFKCVSYIKSTQKLESYPEKIFGQKIELGDFVDTMTNIFYLSESVSNFSFRQPDRIKEEMISSTVSGNPKAYSFNQASDLLIDFYQNLIQISGLTPRGIVSPISGSALFYYDYRLEGTFMENGYTINKIKVIPKRKNDPVFSGDIFILNDSWRIHSLDLKITKAQQIEVIDTFQIKQSFVPVDKERWMLFNTQYAYHFSIFGFEGSGIVLGIFSQYQIDPGFPKGYFDGMVMKIYKEANTKDSSYWLSNRPVPLTGEEKVDYHRKDSARVLHESEAYMDSMDAKGNKFDFMNLLSGYGYTNSYEGKQYDISSPLENLQFNSVEGWNTGIDFKYRKRWKEVQARTLRITPSLRYGFSNLHWNGKLTSVYHYDPKRNSILEVEGGTDVVQFNSNNPISPTVNSMYSLLARKNYMKIYEKRYGRIKHESELFNGFRFGLATEYADRLPLKNTTSYAIAKTGDRVYTSNVPQFPLNDDLHFTRNESFTIEADVRIRFRQSYIDSPEKKFIIGSKYPELRVSYKKGLDVFHADTDYDLVKASISDELRAGLLGKFTYVFSAGSFIQKEQLSFMDAYHFTGNKTWFTSFRLEEFRNLDYYTWSTTASFVEAHAEQNFGGFLLNKIPFIRKLMLKEVAGVHYLYTERAGHYSEVTVGIERLNFIRLELYTSFAEGKRGTIGFVFGIRRNISTQ